MTLPKKGRREVIIDGIRYHWRCTGNDGTIDLTVMLAGAYGQLLRVFFDYAGVYSRARNQPGVFRHRRQGRSITPTVVETVVDWALNNGWTPNTSSPRPFNVGADVSKQLAPVFVRLAAVVNHLIVRPMQVAPEGTATTVYVCHIELHGSDLGEIQQKALRAAEYKARHQRQIRAAQRQYAALLTAPGDGESEAEQSDIWEEFHPPAGNDLARLPAADPWAQTVDGDVAAVEPEPLDIRSS
jgi:hypothetical protein